MTLRPLASLAYSVIPAGKNARSLYEFRAVKQKNVAITFIAGSEESHLNFYINAPFSCNPSRNDVNKKDADSVALIKEIAALLKESLLKLKELFLINESFLSLLPIVYGGEVLPEFYIPIAEAVKDSFINEALLCTISGEYVKTSDALCLTGEEVKLFNLEELRVLFKNENLGIIPYPFNSYVKSFLNSLEIPFLSPLKLLNCMAALSNISYSLLTSLLHNIEDNRLKSIYLYLAKYVNQLGREANYSSNGKKEFDRIKATFSSLCIVKATDDFFYLPKDVAIVSENISCPARYHSIKDTLLVDKEGKTSTNNPYFVFFTNIGVTYYGESSYRKDLDKMSVNEFITYLSRVEITDDAVEVAKRVIGFMEKNASAIKSNGVDIKKYSFVKVEKDGENILVPPNKCCIDSPYSATGFRGVCNFTNKYPINIDYQQLSVEDKDKWISFLEENNALVKIKVKCHKLHTGYETGLDIDYKIDDLLSFLSHINRELSLLIWNAIIKIPFSNWEVYSKRVYKEKRGSNTEYTPSTLVKLLINKEWILGKDGKFYKPSCVMEGMIDSAYNVNYSNGVLHSIDFGKECKENADRIAKEKAQYEQFARSVGCNSVEEISTKLNIFRQLEREGYTMKDLTDLINSKKRGQKVPFDSLLKRNDYKGSSKEETDNDAKKWLDYASPIENKERRRSKINERLKERSHEKKSVGNITTIDSSEEKSFLYGEYHGACQICGKKIKKKDGSFYFEAINLLDTGRLEEGAKSGIGTGWNSLSLCPNCVAEYKYGKVDLGNIKERVMRTEAKQGDPNYHLFPIIMQGEIRRLKYSPKHLLSLQEAIKHFTKE